MCSSFICRVPGVCMVVNKDHRHAESALVIGDLGVDVQARQSKWGQRLFMCGFSKFKSSVTVTSGGGTRSQRECSRPLRSFSVSVELSVSETHRFT